VREIGKADASHAWCASLMIHHPHYISQFAEDAQRAVWADGLDLPIAASILPSARVTSVDGGYRISGQFPFASGINHSRWVIVGGPGRASAVASAGPAMQRRLRIGIIALALLVAAPVPLSSNWFGFSSPAASSAG
jgi:alkylation response protein AidB-like acyl-CoA dehydrogenase